MSPRPLSDLFTLYVLQPALVETYSYRAPKPFLLVVVGEVAQLLELELVALPLVDVGEGGFSLLCSYARRSRQNVLETKKKMH